MTSEKFPDVVRVPPKFIAVALLVTGNALHRVQTRRTDTKTNDVNVGLRRQTAGAFRVAEWLQGGHMRQTILAFIGVAALSIPATAQHPLLTSGLEVRSFAGAYLPTGAQYTDFKPGAMFGAQLADEISEHYHVLGSLAWADGRNKFASLAQSRTSIWQYDIGVEANANAWLNETWLLRPLVGVGVGGRIYDYRLANVDTYSCSVGYASVGSELQRGLVAFRFDARDYVTCFKSPLRSGSTTRNDVTLTFGFVYHIR